MYTISYFCGGEKVSQDEAVGKLEKSGHVYLYRDVPAPYLGDAIHIYKENGNYIFGLRRYYGEVCRKNTPKEAIHAATIVLQSNWPNPVSHEMYESIQKSKPHKRARKLKGLL